MNNVTLLYIVYGNKRGVNTVLKDAGYSRPPKNPNEAIDMLQDYISHVGLEAEHKILAIHPDAGLFQKALSNPNTPLAADAQELLNCSGCDKKFNCIAADGRVPGQPAMNADGPVPGQPALRSISEKTINTLIVAGAGVLAVALITVVVVNMKK